MFVMAYICYDYFYIVLGIAFLKVKTITKKAKVVKYGKRKCQNILQLIKKVLQITKYFLYKTVKIKPTVGSKLDRLRQVFDLRQNEKYKTPTNREATNRKLQIGSYK